jgi:hypothetical protein
MAQNSFSLASRTKACLDRCYTIHLGVYLTSGRETYQAVRWALEVCLSCSCDAPSVGSILM